MWSFEGDYRRKPQQRLGGASKTRNIERSDLLNQLKADREERERQRRREAAAVTLQAWARGVLSQRRTKLDLRHQYDSYLALTKAQGISEGSAIRLIALLIRIFHPQEDSDRLLAVCQLVIREQKQLAEWVCGSCERWTYLLPRLANMALMVITHPVQGEGDNPVSHAGPLRLLEIVLAPDSWSTRLSPSHQHLFLSAVYSHLINKGFYHQIVQLLITRVPEVYESSQEPPTPLADALLHLLLKPLTFASSMTDTMLLYCVLAEMCQHVLGEAVHSQISNYIIPCLASNTKYKLPMDRMVAVLVTHSLKFMDTCPAPALLYSLLMLVRSGADFQDVTSLCNYLQAIGELLGGTTSYLTCSDAEVDSDDEEEDTMDSSKPLNPVLCKLAEECVSVVNSTEHVGWLLSQVERYVSPEVLLHFSRLTHHLLTAPSLQLHQCRLLYSVVVRANHENVINEVQNQKEDENNQVHAGFFADDPQRQGYNTTGSNGGSSQHSSVDQTSRDLQAQEDELRELGIDVVDQVSLERRVEAAVDKAVATHARKQKLQILKKEIKDIRMESKSAENKMLALKNRLTGMQQRVVDPRMYFRVEEDMNSKAQQLKTLREREKFLEQKLASAETNAEELDDLELEEGEILEEEEETQEIDMKDNSEREKLIREGQMTPFGTTSNASKTVSFPRPSKIYTEKHLSVGKKDSTLKSKTEIISCGEMTLFGTILEPADTSNRLSDTQSGAIGKFEQYLQDQFSRQKQHNGSSKDVSCKKSSGDPSYGFPKKRRKKLKEYVGVYDNGNDNHDNLNFSKNQGKAKKSNKKDPLKKHILHPKKRRTEKVSLTVTSTLESDQLKLPPRRLLSEHVSFEGSDSEYSDNQERDSDYFPSDYDCADVIESENDENFESENIGEKRKYILKIRNKKKVEGSDEMSSEDDVPKVKQKNRKSKDDGNIADYMKRVETWKKERLKKKQDKILKGEDLDSEEEEEQGYEQFTGGYKVPLLVWNKLYKYQKTCVRWLWELHSQGCGGILGDEMGLGKTIQIISFLVGLSYSGLSYRRQRWNGLGPTLVVCPATVLHQWVKEFHIWWPPFRVAVLHESGSFTGTRPALISNINSHSGILVTSYTGVRDQLETLLQYDWHYIILDEGHKIRNPEAQITVALKRFQTPHRLILSGSPIQNSLKELWSLFDFVFPGKLGTLPVFLQQFAVPITQGGYANATKLEVQTAFKCASMLRDTINPFLLRRMKNDVRSHLSLPDKNEQVLFCSLSDEQRKIYSEYIAGDQVKAIMGGRAKVFVGLINLRKICNHPDLYTGGPVGENTTWNSGLQPELRYGWWSRSGKMHVLRSILQLWSSQGHRVLLFTQSRQMMCILEKFLMDESYSYLKMDGTTTVASRQPLINKFNSDPSYFVFLLTTRVGGLGVNLTGADRVVIYDPDWNPSTDSQARERAWRIGQLRHVTIYRLLMAGTIEEKIYHRQIFKQFLTNRVLKDPKQQRFFKTNDLYELFSLTEGEKEKTESSAIFAGTGSEIKLGVKKKQSEQSEKKKTDPHRNRETCDKVEVSSLPKGRVFTNNPMSKTQNKSHEKKKSIAMSVENVDKNSAQVGLNQVEKMKELAKLISKKIGSTKKLQDEPIDSIHLDSSHKEEGNTDDKSLDSSLIGEGKDDDKTSSNILPNNDMEVKMSENNVDEEKPGTFAVKDFIISKPSAVENIADMKLVAETETSCTKGLTFTSLSLSCEEVSHHQGKEKRSTKLANVDKCLEKAEEKSKPSGSILFKALSIGNYERERNKAQEMHSDKFEINSDLNTEQIRNSNKHKKKYKDKSKEKHKEHHKKGKKFEGMRIEYLAKKRKYKKTEEEEMEEKELSKSQDQYVLEKLFRKSGIHGALSHDAIMNNSDPDYLLVEGEAERVAKEALKAVRASRARCFRPQPIESKQLSLGKSTLKFGKNKSQIFKEVSYVGGSKMKDGSHKEQKIPMFSGGFEEEIKDNTDVKDGGESKLNTPLCNEQGVGSSGILSSSQLLSRMRQRNKGIALDSENEEEDDYDPDYPSTAPVDEESLEPEIQENIDLLADIRNFVAFQAEIDGQATTQEIISRFQERLPASQTPFFKALLTQICDFHRDNSGRGIWSLKGEFR